MGLLQHCCIQGEKKYDDNLTRASTLHSAFIGRTDGPYNVIKVGNENNIIEIRVNTKYCSPYNDYDIIGLIGIGTYGKSFKIRNKKTGKIKSMKVISENQLKKSFKEEDLIHEIKVLKSVSHYNIMKLSDVYRDEDDYFLISDYCIEGNLNKLIIQYKRLPEMIVKKIMKDIFSAVYYLHISEIIHGDIKLENILLYNNNLSKKKYKRNKSLNFGKFLKNENLLNKSSEIMSSKSLDNSTDGFSNNFNLINNLEKYDSKLIDFGLYNIFTQRKKMNYKDKIDYLYFSAPDILKNNINEKVDIWSCGAIMYYLLTGELPFKGENESDTYDKIINGKFCFKKKLFKKISFDAKDLIKRCFIYEPSERISSQEALEHSFFKSDKEIEFDNSEIYFSSESNFFKTILLILIYNCENHKEELIQIKDNFILLDSDNNRKINKEKANCLCQKLNLNIKLEDINLEFFSLFDIIKLAFNIHEIFSEDNLKIIFTLFKNNSNLIINLNEINNLIGIKEKDYNDIIIFLLKELNKTEYDEFSFEEFKDIIEQCIN